MVATTYAAYRLVGWSKADDFKSKIEDKKKARVDNQKNLEAALLVDGQVTIDNHPELKWPVGMEAT